MAPRVTAAAGGRLTRTVLIWLMDAQTRGLLPRAYHHLGPRPCYRLPLAAIADRKTLAILSNRDRKSAATASDINPGRRKGGRQRRPAPGQEQIFAGSDANSRAVLTFTDASKSDETVAHPWPGLQICERLNGDDDGCLSVVHLKSERDWLGRTIDQVWSIRGEMTMMSVFHPSTEVSL